MAKGTFRSLKVFNYRVWAIGSLVFNVGTWMQRTAHGAAAEEGIRSWSADSLQCRRRGQTGPNAASLKAIPQSLAEP
jgi:hypothetical protein